MSKKIIIDFVVNLNFSAEEVREFIKKNWIRETLLSDEYFYSWQFLDPILNENKDFSILAVYEDKIIGFLGLNKREFILKENSFNAAELTTWIINKEYQKKGFAKPMLEFIKDNFDIAVGANITSAALKVYLRLGFFYINEIPRLLKIYDYQKASSLGVIDPVIRKVYRNKNCLSVKYKEIDLTEIKDVVHRDGFSRSLKNLVWRYKKHPIYKYEVLTTMFSKEKPIYIIYRIEYVKNVKIMIITDILSSSIEYIDLSLLDSYVVDNNIDMVEFYSINTKLNSIMCSQGFIPSYELKDFMDIPYLYNPLELKKSKSYSLIFYAKNDLLLDCLDSSLLYITKADLDLDRPNYEYLKKIGKL